MFRSTAKVLKVVFKGFGQVRGMGEVGQCGGLKSACQRPFLHVAVPARARSTWGSACSQRDSISKIFNLNMDALRSAHCLLCQKPTSVFGGSPVPWKCGIQANVVVSMKLQPCTMSICCLTVPPNGGRFPRATRRGGWHLSFD